MRASGDFMVVCTSGSRGGKKTVTDKRDQSDFSPLPLFAPLEMSLEARKR